ncbi:hypothetical protein P171DRAFT_444582 [Karstenula rhodostoma CBS 690.94]|uniref:Uncharacterized protein n=1 Tax=Karstenula rhodostoma CBS 690.94 TaxID=1392251 RepID=A0A9P4PI62_9PLEO|nr:hypothetical protein P171DRAFT_444582 [Karstenula rhodostoma CBS 690.94]
MEAGPQDKSPAMAALETAKNELKKNHPDQSTVIEAFYSDLTILPDHDIVLMKGSSSSTSALVGLTTLGTYEVKTKNLLLVHVKGKTKEVLATDSGDLTVSSDKGTVNFYHRSITKRDEHRLIYKMSHADVFTLREHYTCHPAFGALLEQLETAGSDVIPKALHFVCRALMAHSEDEEPHPKLAQDIHRLYGHVKHHYIEDAQDAKKQAKTGKGKSDKKTEQQGVINAYAWIPHSGKIAKHRSTSKATMSVEVDAVDGQVKSIYLARVLVPRPIAEDAVYEGMNRHDTLCVQVYTDCAYEPRYEELLPMEGQTYRDWQEYLITTGDPIFWGEYEQYTFVAPAIANSGIAIKGNETGEWSLFRNIHELRQQKVKSLERDLFLSEAFTITNLEQACKVWELGDLMLFRYRKVY